MAKAIGMVECSTVSTGFTAADEMVKAADVEIIQAEVTCPGKYVVIVTGEISAVRASVDRVATRFGDKIIDTFVLGNPHEYMAQQHLRRLKHLVSLRHMM